MPDWSVYDQFMCSQYKLYVNFTLTLIFLCKGLEAIHTLMVREHNRVNIFLTFKFYIHRPKKKRDL